MSHKRRRAGGRAGNGWIEGYMPPKTAAAAVLDSSNAEPLHPLQGCLARMHAPLGAKHQRLQCRHLGGLARLINQHCTQAQDTTQHAQHMAISSKERARSAPTQM